MKDETISSFQENQAARRAAEAARTHVASILVDGRAEEQRLGRELRDLATVDRQTEADDQEALIK